MYLDRNPSQSTMAYTHCLPHQVSPPYQGFIPQESFVSHQAPVAQPGFVPQPFYTPHPSLVPHQMFRPQPFCNPQPFCSPQPFYYPEQLFYNPQQGLPSQLLQNPQLLYNAQPTYSLQNPEIYKTLYAFTGQIGAAVFKGHPQQIDLVINEVVGVLGRSRLGWSFVVKEGVVGWVPRYVFVSRFSLCRWWSLTPLFF